MIQVLAPKSMPKNESIISLGYRRTNLSRGSLFGITRLADLVLWKADKKLNLFWPTDNIVLLHCSQASRPLISKLGTKFTNIGEFCPELGYQRTRVLLVNFVPSLDIKGREYSTFTSALLENYIIFDIMTTALQSVWQ